MKRILKSVLAAALVLGTLFTSALTASAFAFPGDPEIVLTVENCKNYVTIREKPNTKSAEVALIPKGGKVTYLGYTKNGFYEISYCGFEGYVLSKYLGYSDYEPGDDGDEDFHNAADPWVVVDCKEFITIRDKASGKGADIVKIPLGAVVDYLGSAGKSYCEIIYRGIRGYVQKAYLRPVESLTDGYATFSMEVVKCKKSVTLRSTPSTNGKEIMQIPLGATVEYLDTAENNFYKVSYKNNIGYVLKNYLQ